MASIHTEVKKCFEDSDNRRVFFVQARDEGEVKSLACCCIYHMMLYQTRWTSVGWNRQQMNR